jgi:hypothetical protein
MKDDIYAIYESYSTGEPVRTKANFGINHTTRNQTSYAYSPQEYNPSTGNVAGEQSETRPKNPSQLKVNRDIAKLSELVNKGDYQAAVVYCNSINKQIQDLFNK